MYIYHLHSYINDPKNFNSLVIRFLLEDIIYAENNNLDFLDLIYGAASRYELRSKIYPSFMTYRKWIEISKNYPALILSLNFDVHSWKYKIFCKKILEQFPRNKKIIVAAGNEVYEKRGEAEKVYQTTKEVYEAMQEIGKFYPIAFWSEKIYTAGEKEAVEKLLNDKRVKDICEYFAFQSLETSNSKIDKYVKMAKSKGFKCLDIELGTITSSYSEIKSKFDLDRNLEIDNVVILCPTVHSKLANDPDFSIWGKYGLLILYDGDYNIYIKDKHKLINYIQQFKTSEEEMGLSIADEYKLNDKNDRIIDFIQDMLIQLKYLPKSFINFGDFNKETEEAVKLWQAKNGCAVNGKVSKWQIWAMIEQQENPESKFRQLVIYAS